MSRLDLPSLGLRVRHMPGPPLVSFRARLRGGVLNEKEPGLALLTGRMLAEGTSRRDWRQIVVDAENYGIYLQSFTSGESIGVSIDALAADADLALEWMAEILTEPTFPQERFEWLRKQATAELEALLDQPNYRTGRAFSRQLYGEHPYGRALHGSPEDLARRTSEECIAYHRQALAWGGVIVVTGAIDEEEILGKLERRLGGVMPAPEPRPLAPPPEPREPMEQELVCGEADQAHVFSGHLTIERRNPDLPALDLLGVVLGAGAAGNSGRLPTRIREQEGLAYAVEVATSAGAGHGPGHLMVYCGTSPDKAKHAGRATFEELEKLLQEGIAEEEMEEARSYLLGSDALRRETLRQWSDLLATSVLFGLKTEDPAWVAERYRSLTKEDLEAAARRHIRPQDLRLTIGWPEKTTRARRARK
jgi:zinc protease